MLLYQQSNIGGRMNQETQDTKNNDETLLLKQESTPVKTGEESSRKQATGRFVSEQDELISEKYLDDW